MPKNLSYICTNCENMSVQWAGVCNKCQEWNTYVKKDCFKNKVKKSKTFQNISQITSPRIIKTGFSNVDNVLGRGLIEGSVTLISGEPGIGKSTLLLGLLSKALKINKGLKILYVSGEESIGQLYQRATRLKSADPNLNFLNTSSWQEVLECLLNEGFDLVLLDSIQTLRDEEVSSSQGSPTQVKAITNEILEKLKTNLITTLIVGHKTKDGSIAGPKLLEHMVDTVLTLNLNENGQRVLTSTKNRYGPTNHYAYFEMKESGLIPIDDKMIESSDLLKEVGTSLCLSNRNGREVLLQLQSIVIENPFGTGKRICQGIEQSRLSLLVAIVEKVLKISLSSYDIYFKVSWDHRIQDKHADLPIVAAILSSYYEKVLPHNCFYHGELSMGGTVKEPLGQDTILNKSMAGIEKVKINNLEELRSIIIDTAS